MVKVMCSAQDSVEWNDDHNGLDKPFVAYISLFLNKTAMMLNCPSVVMYYGHAVFNLELFCSFLTMAHREWSFAYRVCWVQCTIKKEDSQE